MADLEKLKRKPKTKDEEVGRLYKESLKGKPNVIIIFLLIAFGPIVLHFIRIC